MVDEDQPLVVAGHASVRLYEGGRKTEAVSPLRLVVDDVTRFTGRPENPPVESDSPEVKRFARRAAYAMKPPPAPRPIIPVPKPTRTIPKSRPDEPVTCPLCRGVSWPDCEACDGAGVVPPREAARWADTHFD